MNPRRFRNVQFLVTAGASFISRKDKLFRVLLPLPEHPKYTGLAGRLGVSMLGGVSKGKLEAGGGLMIRKLEAKPSSGVVKPVFPDNEAMTDTLKGITPYFKVGYRYHPQGGLVFSIHLAVFREYRLSAPGFIGTRTRERHWKISPGISMGFTFGSVGD